MLSRSEQALRASLPVVLPKTLVLLINHPTESDADEKRRHAGAPGVSWARRCREHRARRLVKLHATLHHLPSVGEGIVNRWLSGDPSQDPWILLEILVHVRQDQIPNVWIRAEIPETLTIETIDALPDSPADYGTAWLNSARSPILSVPSVIVPERNYLLNPGHPGFGIIQWAAPRDLQIDSRLTGPGVASGAGSASE